MQIKPWHRNPRYLGHFLWWQNEGCVVLCDVPFFSITSATAKIDTWLSHDLTENAVITGDPHTFKPWTKNKKNVRSGEMRRPISQEWLQCPVWVQKSRPSTSAPSLCSRQHPWLVGLPTRLLWSLLRGAGGQGGIESNRVRVGPHATVVEHCERTNLYVREFGGWKLRKSFTLHLPPISHILFLNWKFSTERHLQGRKVI